MSSTKISIKLDSKFLADTSFLYDKAPVTAAMLRDTTVRPSVGHCLLMYCLLTLVSQSAILSLVPRTTGINLTDHNLKMSALFERP
jgi:hypothetical protein